MRASFHKTRVPNLSSSISPWSPPFELVNPWRNFNIPLSRKGNRYVIIMVEHFSKWMELVTIPRKEAKYTAEAFLHRVLTLFGAPAEVLTDQGTEFEGEFQALLEECLVHHRRTSRDHPQADGLAERCVQSVKLALRKLCGMCTSPGSLWGTGAASRVP